jgi:hypothetical protein
MRKTLLITLTSFALTTFVVTAADPKPDISKLPPAADKKDLTFDKDIKPILEKSCFSCHGPEKQKSEYRVDSRETIIKGGESGNAAIIPGKSAESPLIFAVGDLIEDSEMPPVDKRDKYPALTKDQLALIRAWIDQGAK